MAGDGGWHQKQMTDQTSLLCLSQQEKVPMVFFMIGLFREKKFLLQSTWITDVAFHVGSPLSRAGRSVHVHQLGLSNADNEENMSLKKKHSLAASDRAPIRQRPVVKEAANNKKAPTRKSGRGRRYVS